MYASVWCMFFSSVVSFQYHPGTKERMSLDQCAAVADYMFEKFLEREALWRGSELQ